MSKQEIIDGLQYMLNNVSEGRYGDLEDSGE